LVIGCVCGIIKIASFLSKFSSLFILVLISILFTLIATLILFPGGLVHPIIVIVAASLVVALSVEEVAVRIVKRAIREVVEA